MSLYSLVYASTAVHPFSPEELEGLLEVSRLKNGPDDLTGMLVYKDGEFMQVLEGEKTSVQAAAERIARDPRHHSVVTVLEGDIPARSFPDWSMGFCNLEAVDLESVPGFSEFLNTPLTARAVWTNPSLAQRMLGSFKEKGWLGALA